QTVQLDAMLIGMKPCAALFGQPVAGAVVDNQKELLTAISSDEQLQKLVEGAPIEQGGGLVRGLGILQREPSVDVSGLPPAVRHCRRLNAHTAPSLVQRPVEPEARLVLEENYPATGGGFFLIAGNTRRSQKACASWSAFARRLRGRCTENPSW